MTCIDRHVIVNRSSSKPWTHSSIMHEVQNCPALTHSLPACDYHDDIIHDILTSDQLFQWVNGVHYASLWQNGDHYMS